MLLLIAILLQQLSAVTAPAQPSILGEWEAMQTSKGGIGYTLHFDRDGSMTSTIGAMVDFSYTFSDQHLTTVFVDPSTGKSESETIVASIDGDTLTEKDARGPGKDLVMKRVGHATDAKEPIIGTWTYAHYAGPDAYVTFTRKGEMHFRLPMRSEKGTWSNSGTRLSVNLPSEPKIEWTFSVDGDVLTLTSHGKESKYKRKAPPD